MIGHDVQVVDLEGGQLRRLMSWLEPDEGAGDGGGVLLIVHRGPEVLKVMHGARRLPPSAVDFTGPKDFPVLRKRFGAAVAVALAHDAVGEIIHQFQAACRMDQRYLEQVLLALETVRAQVGTRLHLDPPGPLLTMHLPSARTLSRLQRLALPPGKVAVFYAMESSPRGQRVAASLVIRQGRDAHLDLITTDAHLGDEGLKAETWREDLDRVCRRIAERVGPIHLACFAEAKAVTGLLASGFSLELLDAMLADGRVVLPARPFYVRMVLKPFWRRMLRLSPLRGMRALLGPAEAPAPTGVALEAAPGAPDAAGPATRPTRGSGETPPGTPAAGSPPSG